MEARTYLSQALRSGVRIEALRERRERYRQLAEQGGTLYRYSAGGTLRVSSVEEYGCRMADLAREMERRIDALAGTVADIQRTIDALPDARYRELLTYRYLNGWRWERIAGAMLYSVDRVQHLHGEALREVERILERKGAEA